MLPDNPDGKTNACLNDVLKIWEENKDKRLTQMVFCDLSTPKSDGRFNVYDDLKSKLMERGVPEHEIAYIHDAKTEVQKAALFSRVRSGQVRILIGSTAKMGAGTNVQRLLKAEHHLDIPWRPSDIEQREGRAVRQGNTNENVRIFRYVTENTFDAYMWQTIENKQKFIAQIQTSKSPVRSAEDIDETALSYAEVKALATGNPHIKEKMDLEVTVSRLKLLKADYLSKKYALEDSLMKHWPQSICSMEERVAGYKADVALYAQHRSEEFPGMTLKGRDFAEKKDAGAELIAICKAQTDPSQKDIGTYMGFTLLLSFDTVGKQFKLTLKGERSHTIELGDDICGNIQRMDNVFAALPIKLSESEQALADVRKQAKNAKAEAGKPFAQEFELKQKSTRLAELDALLNMDKRENDTLDLEPEQEDSREREPKQMEMER